MTHNALSELTSVTWAGVAVVEAALLLHAALHDVAVRTIPHAICVALVAIGLLQRARDHQVFMATAAAAGVFAACAVLWRMRWLGGGDVKLIAATCCLVPPHEVPALLAAIAVSGGLLACAYLLAMRCLAREGDPARADPDHRTHAHRGLVTRIARLEMWRIRRRGALPYGVAVSAGALLHVLGG